MPLKLLYKSLLEYALERVVNASEAVSQAKDAATSKESVAETKWDTFGLENSYLAHGQAMRLAECEEDLAYFRQFTFSDSQTLELGSVLLLERADGWRRMVVIAGRCGGGEFNCAGGKALIVTPQTPLGQSLLSKEEGDELLMKSRGVTVEAVIERIFVDQV